MASSTTFLTGATVVATSSLRLGTVVSARRRAYDAAYPGLLTDGIDDPDKFIYKGIVADCLRGAEFLFGRSQVDG